MKLKIMMTTALISAAVSPLSYAFFCPTNFNNIDIGDSMAKVEQQCGAPGNKEIKDPPDTKPQQWSYFLQPQPTGQVPTNAQGTLKTSFAFDGDGRVVNISVNGIGVSSISTCRQPISMGSTRDAVKDACGEPILITKQNQSESAQAAPDAPIDLNKKQVEFTYSGTPPVTLVFLNGRLAEKR